MWRPTNPNFLRIAQIIRWAYLSVILKIFLLQSLLWNDFPQKKINQFSELDRVRTNKILLRRKFCADSKPVVFFIQNKKSPIVWTATHPLPISFPLANISSSVKIRTNLKVHNFLKICSKFYHLRCTNLALHIVSNLPFSGGRRNHDESKLLVGSVANVTQPWEVI